MLSFIKSCQNLYGKKSPFCVYEDLGSGKIDLSKLPREGFAQVVGGEADQNSSYKIQDLFENYCSSYSESQLNGERIKKEMQQFLRKDKIVEIENSTKIK